MIKNAIESFDMSQTGEGKYLQGHRVREILEMHHTELYRHWHLGEIGKSDDLLT